MNRGQRSLHSIRPIPDRREGGAATACDPMNQIAYNRSTRAAPLEPYLPLAVSIPYAEGGPVRLMHGGSPWSIHERGDKKRWF